MAKTEVKAEIMAVSDGELESVWLQLEKGFEAIYRHLHECADVIGRMSRHQLALTKKRFKGIIAANTIDLLAMYGRGEIAEHLLKPLGCPPLSAGILESIPKEDLARLNDPETVVAVPTGNGVRHTTVSKANPISLRHIVRHGTGIVEPTQVKRMADRAKMRVPRRAEAMDAARVERCEKLLPGSKKGEVLIYGAAGSIIAVPLKSLRSILAES